MGLKTPLYRIHRELGARFTEFAGYEMPLQFSTIKEEHIAVRTNVGLFDVSHMGNIWIRGKDAEKLISLTTVEDASRITDGKGQYTVILREDGTVIDDIIFMHLSDKYMMIPNAGMSHTVELWLNEKAKNFDLDAHADDVSKDFAILAVQGPKSKETLQKLTDSNIGDIKFFECRYIDIDGVNCIVSHTGYTGELGYELQITPAKAAEKLFLHILEAGREYGIKPVGLGARDTLRLEKCFILAGNEFKGGRTPLEANLSWTINWDHDFIGKDALLKQRQQGGYERLTCLECIEKGVPRHGMMVQKDGKKIGVVSSGTMSPCLNTGIALAYIHPDYRETDSILDIVIREKKVKAKVVKPPFVKKDWKK